MDPTFEPKVLVCDACGEEFAITVAAQQYFAERGHTKDPEKCKSCYAVSKGRRKSIHGISEKYGNSQ